MKDLAVLFKMRPRVNNDFKSGGEGAEKSLQSEYIYHLAWQGMSQSQKEVENPGSWIHL